MSSNIKQERKSTVAEDLITEGVEGEVTSVIPMTELEERAEFEEITGTNFDTHLPTKIVYDEIDAFWGAHIDNYVDPELLTEQGTVSILGSSSLGLFAAGEGAGFSVGYRVGFHSLQGRGFSIGTGVGFNYIQSKGFDINFSSTQKEGFDPDVFDTRPEDSIPIIQCNWNSAGLV